MAETLLNYGIFFIVIIFIAIIAAVVRRSSILTNLFGFLGKSMLLFLQALMLIFFTVIISMLVGLIIFIHPYLYGTSHFFADGEAVHFLSSENQALLQFSATYGVLYMIIFFISSRFLTKTGLTKFFIRIARTIRRIVPYQRSHQKLENKIIGTACKLMASSIMILIYPLAIYLLFPQLEVTVIGNLSIFICLFIFSIIPLPGYANSRQDRSYYRTRPIRPRSFQTRK